MIEQKIDEHPAAEAWLEFNRAHRWPSAVTALYDAKSAVKKNKKKKKSAVFRLDGVGPNGSALVAKRCDRKTGRVEQDIYENILPRLPVTSLKCHGSVEIDGAFWLFLDYVGGVEWQIEDKAHLNLAIDWLARMHGCSARLESLSRLPDRGQAYYQLQLKKTLKRIEAARSNPALQLADIEILDRFVAQAEALDPRWSQMHDLCSLLPLSLVHNDFVKKNVQVQFNKKGPALMVFDWEMAGRGLPAVDINWMFQKAPDVAIRKYHEKIKKEFPSIRLKDMELMATLGAVFRIADAVEWASHDLLSDYPQNRITHFERYSNRLVNARIVLGWD